MWTKRSEDGPIEGERLTRVAARLLEAWKADPEYRDDDKTVLMMHAGPSEPDSRGGIAVSGYEDELDCLTDVVVHLRAMTMSRGKTMSIMIEPIGALN